MQRTRKTVKEVWSASCAKREKEATKAQLIDARPLRSRISGGAAYKTASDTPSTPLSSEIRPTRQTRPAQQENIGGKQIGFGAYSGAHRTSEQDTRSSRPERLVGLASRAIQPTPGGLYSRVPFSSVQTNTTSGPRPTRSPVPLSRSLSLSYQAPDLTHNPQINVNFLKSVITRWSPKWFDESGKKTFVYPRSTAEFNKFGCKRTIREKHFSCLFQKS